MCIVKAIDCTYRSWWDHSLDGDTLKSSDITVHIMTMIFIWDYKILCNVTVNDKGGCAKERYYSPEGAEVGRQCGNNP